MLELSAFLRLRWPIYGTAPEIKKKKEKRITKHGRHYSSYRKKKTNNWVGNGLYCFNGSSEEKKKKVLRDIGEQNL